MKILFISDMLAEGNTGGALLSLQHYNTLKSLYGKDVKIITICENISRKKIEDKKNEFNIKISYKNKINMIKNSINLNYPLISKEIEKSIINMIYEENIEVLFIDNSMYGKIIKKVKKIYPNLKIITFFHDIKYDLLRQHLMNYGVKFIPKYLTGIYNEKMTVKYSDKNIVLSLREFNLYKKIYSEYPDEIIPIYSVDKNKIEICKKNIKDVRERLQVLFVGGYYYPNIKGVKWFIKNVLGEVDIELSVVGYNMEKLRKQISHNRLNIVGSVENISEYYYNADLIIAPIFEGGGMKTKVAEALMYGKYIIGTNEAFEGYENVSDECCNICNDKNEFINAIIEFNNKYNGMKFNLKSRKTFLENYSEEVIRDKIKKIIES